MNEIITNIEVLLELVETTKEETDIKMKNSMLDDIEKLLKKTEKKIKNLKS